MQLNTTKVTPKEATNYSVGLAFGIIITWGISFAADVPGEIGASIGSICVWLAWRFKLGGD